LSSKKSSPHSVWMRELFTTYDQMAMRAFRSIGARAKADGTTVTDLDKQASALFLNELKRRTPEYGIVSEEEEGEINPGADWKWVLDPVDGTASFSRGYPVWGVGLGLMKGAEPREGYLSFPALNETYAWHDGELYLNGEPSAFPQSDPLDDNRNILVDASYHRSVRTHEPLWDTKLRILGSTLYHLVSLAMGRCEAMICGRSSLWDLAAALPLSRHQGMVEWYLDGTPLEIAALSAKEHYRLRQPLLIGPPDVLARLQPAVARSMR